MKVEYLTIADSRVLQPAGDWYQFPDVRVFTAVKIGAVRLIDNVAMKPKAHNYTNHCFILFVSFE